MGTIAALSSRSFEKQLAFGQIAETDIAKWIMARGGVVLPVYDIEYETGKGPRVFRKGEQLAAPDLLVFSKGQLKWIEAKHKTHFTWYRNHKRWTTGINANHYRDYCQVEQVFGVPVWLLFLHQCSTPSAIDRKHDGCPEECPVGLFGRLLSELQTSVNHTSDKWGRHGMVYWAHETLKLLAPIEEVRKSARECTP